MSEAATKMASAVARLGEGESLTGRASTVRQSTSTLLAYGGLALPLCLAALPILTYLPAFYAQELHLSAGLVGMVFLCARLWDALSNLLIGWFSDRSKSRWGRRKPWVIVGAPVLLVSTWCICNPPRGAGLIYLGVWVMVFYTALAAMYVPYLSWGTELATEYVERSRVTSFRETFTMLGNLFFAAGPLIFLVDGAPLRDVLWLISITMLLTVPLSVVVLGSLVRDPPPAKRVQTHLVADLAGVGRDRVLIRFAVATFLFAVGDGIANSLLVFFFSVGLQLPNRLFWAIFILYVATLCAVPLMFRVARRIEKHRLLAAGVTIQVLVYGTFVIIPPGNFAIVAALQIALGVANSAMLALPTSILADIIDHGDVTSGKRRSGAYVAVYNLVLKFGAALGVGLAFGLLALVNYRLGATDYSAADVNNIRLLTFGLPCLLQIPTILLYLKHPITRGVQQQLLERIHLRQDVGLPGQA